MGLHLLLYTIWPQIPCKPALKRPLPAFHTGSRRPRRRLDQIPGRIAGPVTLWSRFRFDGCCRGSGERGERDACAGLASACGEYLQRLCVAPVGRRKRLWGISVKAVRGACGTDASACGEYLQRLCVAPMGRRKRLWGISVKAVRGACGHPFRIAAISPGDYVDDPGRRRLSRPLSMDTANKEGEGARTPPRGCETAPQTAPKKVGPG